MILELTAILALLINGYFDLKTREVYSLPFYLAAAIAVLEGKIGGLLVGLVIWKGKDIEGRCGGGDIDALALLILIFGMNAIDICFLASVFSFFWCLLRKNTKDIPFVFMLAAAALIFEFFKLFS